MVKAPYIKSDIKIFKRTHPFLPSQRHLVQLNLNVMLDKIKPIKKKSKLRLKKNGRNHSGKITISHRGGGHKKKYRIIDFYRKDKRSVLTHVEYDPNRSAFIARISAEDGESYILAPQNYKHGMALETGENVPVQVGNCTSLRQMPVGSLIHNLSLHKYKKGQYIRSAGTYGQLLKKTNKFARIKLPSKEHRHVFLDCRATYGMVSNENHRYKQLGKAGRSRWMGIRPTVRGVAMNPVDHPHGGGEGKTSGGRPSVTPWGKPTKGQPTRKKKKQDLYLLQKRSRKKRK
jgi:large subunit ribosomal protein L2